MTNPFAPQPPAPAPGNPFGPATPVEPTPPAPAPGNPFGPGAPAAPAPYTPPAPAYPTYPSAPTAYAPGSTGYVSAAPAAPAPAANGGSPWPAGAQAAPPPALGSATAPPRPTEGGGKGAKLADMYGKLCIALPTAYDPARQKPAEYIRAGESATQRQMTVTFVVIDDGNFRGQSPIQFGGNPYVVGGKPHDQSAPLPYINKSKWVTQTRMIDQLMPYMPGGPRAAEVAIGRPLKVSPEHNAAWYLSTPTAEELAFAQQYLDAVAAGHLPHPLA